MTDNQHESVARVAKYARHIQELAAAFRVLVQVQDMDPGDAGAGHLRDNPAQKCIRIAPVTDETTYAVALHELGHCLHPLGQIKTVEGSQTMRMTHRIATLRDVRLQLTEEEAAWEWAHHYALEWTEVMTRVERMAIETYRREARKLGVKS